MTKRKSPADPEALTMPCTACGAQPGKLCLSTSGNQQNFTHPIREGPSETILRLREIVQKAEA